MILDNYNPNYEVLLPTTIAVGILLLLLIPCLVLVYFHHQEEQRRSQAEGDRYAMHLNQPFFTKQRVLHAWLRIAVCFTLGLSLLTVHAAKKSQLQTSFDYIGPMQVRSIEVRSREMWSTSGLTRSWVIRGFATLQVQWTPDEDAEHQTFSSALCVTEHVYEPCIQIAKPCQTMPCAATEVAEEEQRVTACVQDAIESYNKHVSFEELFVTRSSQWEAKDPENLPSLQFRGDSDTCSVRAGVSVKEEEFSTDILAYIGITSIMSGVLLLFIQPLLWYFGRKAFHERRQNGHDGHTECGEDEFSIGSLDEELGKLEGHTTDAATTQGSESLHESAGTFGTVDLQERSGTRRENEESGTSTSQE